MPAAGAIAAGAAAIGGFLQSNAQKNAAKANLANETSLDNQIIGIYDRMMGTAGKLMGAVNPGGALSQAKEFYSSEVTGGLSPAVTGAAESQFQQQNALNLATLERDLGPYTPNKAGMISQFQDSQIIGNVSLQQQLAAMNQGVRQQGAQGLTSVAAVPLDFLSTIGSNAASALGSMAGNYQQASEFNASNAGNPLAFLSTTDWSKLFPNSVATTGTPSTATPGTYTTPPGYVPEPPGQGGAGAVGGIGTQA